VADGKVGGGAIKSKVVGALGIIVLFFSLFQILLGTQVRETMDEVIRALGYEARGEWIDALGTRFYIHRSFSIIIAAVNVFWLYKIRRDKGAGSSIEKIGIWCILVIIAEILTGVIMAYFGVPAYAQPMHLTLAIVLIGLQFVIWLLVNGSTYLKSARGESLMKEFV